MTAAAQTTPSGGAIARLIAVVIVVLAGINGIFTFSGANLYVGERHYALLFAIAVQFSIAVSLLALPYVRGLGRLVLLLIYAAALTLSTASAYTYIYNAGLPGGTSAFTVSTGLKARIADELAVVQAREQGLVDAAREQVAALERAVREEAERGLRSGRGPGEGPEYYRKLEALEAARERLRPLERDLARFEGLRDQVDARLAAGGDPAAQREALILLVSRLGATANDPTSREMLSRLTNERIGVLQNPVERAISALLDRGAYSIQLFVSVIWAAVFDLLALFLGVVRYYILRPDHSILQAIYDGVVDLFGFFVRLGGVRREARLKVRHDLETHSRLAPLNSTEMQNFATYVMAGSHFSARPEEEPLQPLRRLIAHLEPLRLEGDPHGVGVQFEAVEEEPELKTLMALLIQNEVFLSDVDRRVYVLNPGTEMAQKILVFLKMGLQDRAGTQELAKYLSSEGG